VKYGLLRNRCGTKKAVHEGSFLSCVKYLLKFEKAGVALKAAYEIRGSEMKREKDEVHAEFSVEPEDQYSDLV